MTPISTPSRKWSQLTEWGRCTRSSRKRLDDLDVTRFCTELHPPAHGLFLFVTIVMAPTAGLLAQLPIWSQLR